jgi:phage-related protein
MAGSFRIAEGFVEVTADESGYDRAMERLKSKKNMVRIGVDLDDKDARTRLTALLKPRTVKLGVDLDDKAVTTSLRNLAKARKVKLTAELDDKAATTALAKLTRDRTVKLTAHLDDSGVASRLAALSGQQTVDVLPKIQEAAYTAAMKKLEKLTADRNITIRPSVDTRVAAEELRNLTRRQRVRIGVDVDTRVAADDLALLTRPRIARVTADADTAAAATRLAILTRPRTVHLGVGLGGAAVGAAGIGLLSSKFALLAAAALSALPTIVSLGSALIQIGPAAALAAPALGSLITMGGALAVGMHGIGAAFKQAFAPASTGAKTATTSIRQVENAQRSLARAQQGVKDAEVRAAEARVQAARQIEDAQRSLKGTVTDVADANRRAAEQVANAEQDLADAQRSARQAQLDLTSARKDAARQLQDLGNQQEDIELDRRESVMRVADAQADLNAVMANPKATQQQRDEAQLTYDQAVQHLEEIQLQQERLTADAAAANKAGVEGSKTVTDAKRQIADATDEIADKTKALKDAELEQAQTAQQGAEKVAEAERSVADARAASAKAAVDGARSIADANQAVADAARAVADAQTAGAAATARTADALAKLSPNARAFVMAVRAMGPAFSALRMEVQDRLFKGLGESMTRLGAAALPAVRSGLVGMAGVLNGMASNLMDTFTRLGNQGLLTKMFQGFTDGMAPLTKVPGQLGQAFVQLSVAASPAFKRITTAMAGESDKISQKLTDAFESGRLESSIEHAIDLGKRFGHVLGDAFGALKNILGAAAAGSGGALGAFADAFAELRRVTGLPEIQDALTRIFQSFHDIAGVIVSVVGSALENLVPIAAPFVDMIAGIADMAKGPLMGFFQFLGDHKTLVGSIAAGILAIVTAMKLWELATIAVTVVQGILTAVMSANPLGLVILAVAGLAAAFAYAWHESETFRDIVTGVWNALKTAFSATVDWLHQYLIQPFVDVYNFLVGHSLIPDLVNGIVTWFKSLWTSTKKIFTDLKNGIIAIWNGLWSTVKEKWNTFWSGLKTSFTGAWKSFRDSVTGLKTSITNTWSSMWNGARDKVTSIFSTINSKITSFKNGMKSAFSTLRDALGTIWSGIKSKIGSPVKFVIDAVYNHGIRTMWNSIAGKISSSITLPKVPLNFNTGGVVPGTGNTDTVPAMLTPGERILSNQQVSALGGHRAIDAMLGRDQPTRTGGNPSRQQERQREQAGQQHYASGGIVGKVTSGIGGAIGGAYDWAKDVVVGGLKKAAQAAINNLVRPLINQIPGSGIGNLMRGLSNKAVDGMLGWFGNEDKKAVGGPAVQRALSWVKTQNGKPYQWAGNGNPSWDCSGLMSAIESVIRGQKPHRRWATGAFGASAPSGWVRNLNSPFMVGITNSGVGHTAGTLAGMNVESSGGAGVHMGKSARGYKDSMFTSRWGFAPAAKYDSGGLLQPGATMAINKTRKPEAVLTSEEHDAFRSLVTGLSTGGFGGMTVTFGDVNIKGDFDLTNPAECDRVANQLADRMKEAIRKLENSRRR